MATKQIKNPINKTRGINEAELIRAFSAVKRDILANEKKVEEVKKDIEKLTKEIKNNLVDEKSFKKLKLKIGEINDNLKAIIDLQKKLNDLEKQINKNFTDKKTFTDKTNELNKNILELKSDYVSKIDLKKMFDDVSEEFDALRKDATTEYKKVMEEIIKLKNIKDTITYGELMKTTSRLNKRIDSNQKKIEYLNEKSKNFVVEEQIDALIKDVEKEINPINKGLKLLDEKIKKDIDNVKKNLKEKISVDELKELVENINKEFEEVYENLKEINLLKKELDLLVKKSVKKDEFNKLKNVVNGKIEFLKDESNFIKKNFAREKDLKNIKKELETKVEIKDYKKEKEELERKIKELETKIKKLQKNNKNEKEINKMEIVSNVLVIASYIPLIVLIVSYFLGNVIWLKELVSSAIVLFVLGFILKVFNAKR